MLLYPCSQASQRLRNTAQISACNDEQIPRFLVAQISHCPLWSLSAQPASTCPGFPFDIPSALTFTSEFGGCSHFIAISCLLAEVWPTDWVCKDANLCSTNCLWGKFLLTLMDRVLLLNMVSFLQLHCYRQQAAILSGQSLMESLSLWPSIFHSNHSWKGK